MLLVKELLTLVPTNAFRGCWANHLWATQQAASGPGNSLPGSFSGATLPPALFRETDDCEECSSEQELFVRLSSWIPARATPWRAETPRESQEPNVARSSHLMSDRTTEAGASRRRTGRAVRPPLWLPAGRTFPILARSGTVGLWTQWPRHAKAVDHVYQRGSLTLWLWGCKRLIHANPVCLLVDDATYAT